MTPLDAVQDYMFNTLTSDSTITADVYDFVPETARYPFIVIGEGSDRPGPTKGAYHVTAAIHVISSFDGYQEGAELMNNIRSLFEMKKITLDGFSWAMCETPSTNRVRTIEENIRQISANFPVMVLI